MEIKKLIVKKKRKRKEFTIFFGVLKNKHDTYVEIFAKNQTHAEEMMEKEFGEEVDFVYKANRYSENHYENGKLKTLDFRNLKPVQVKFNKL